MNESDQTVPSRSQSRTAGLGRSGMAGFGRSRMAGIGSVAGQNERDKLAHFTSLVEISENDIVGETIEPALRYWQSIRGDRVAPPRREFRLDEIPPRLVPSIAVIEIVGEPIDFLYRFFGTHLVHVAGMELTGKRYYADKIIGFGAINETLIPELMKRRVPMFHDLKWRSSKGVVYESKAMRLPLSDDGETVNGVVTVNTVSPFAKTY